MAFVLCGVLSARGMRCVVWDGTMTVGLFCTLIRSGVRDMSLQPWV